jgi:hypothetical protein
MNVLILDIANSWLRGIETAIDIACCGFIKLSFVTIS